MQKHQLRGVGYCEQAMATANDSDTRVLSVCHFRIGQLLRSAHNYERAMEHLVRAQTLTRATPADSSQPHQQDQETLEQIDKEIDRCRYERSQHDVAYIRTLMQDAQSA